MWGNLVGLRYSDKFHSQTVNTQPLPHQFAKQVTIHELLCEMTLKAGLRQGDKGAVSEPPVTERSFTTLS